MPSTKKHFPLQDLCLAVMTGMPLLSAFFIGLRIFAKRLGSTGVTPDDWLLIVATIFSIVLIYPSWKLTKMWNWGLHIWETPWPYVEPDMDEFYRLSVVFGMFSAFILPLVKASILLLLVRVGGILPSVRKAVYALFAFNALAAIIPAFFILFQCPSLGGNTWRLRTFGNLHCAGRLVIGRINIFQVCVSMFTDLLIFPIPVFLTWKLQKATLRSRLIIVLLFSLSLGATAIGAVRIYLTYNERLYRKVAIDWTYSISFCVNHLEHGVAIIFACVPSLRSLFLRHGEDKESTKYSRRLGDYPENSRTGPGRTTRRSQGRTLDAYGMSIDLESTTLKGCGIETTITGEDSQSCTTPKSEFHSRSDSI